MLHRRKSIKYPKRPKTHQETRNVLQDPQIKIDFGQTVDKYGAFYIDSVVKDKHTFHVFASPSVVNLITNHMVTFTVIPKEFAQLVVISIEYKNDVRIIFA